MDSKAIRSLERSVCKSARCKELKEEHETASTHHAACSRFYISDQAARRRDRTLLQLNAGSEGPFGPTPFQSPVYVSMYECTQLL